MTENNEMKHSPTPWRVDGGQYIDDAQGGRVAYVHSKNKRRVDSCSNATLIVEAVNAHERLVGENEELRREIGEANEYADLLKSAKDGLAKENERLRCLVCRMADEISKSVWAAKQFPWDESCRHIAKVGGELVSEARAAIGEEATNG